MARRLLLPVSKDALGGRGADEISKRADWIELRKRLDDCAPEDRRSVVQDWLIETRRLVDESTLSAGKKERVVHSAISNAEHGLCAAVSIEARHQECRKAGGSLSSLFNGLGPDKAHRTTQRCGGCINYMIWQKHLPYWKDRFSGARQSVIFFELQGEPLSVFEAQLAIAKQAQARLTAVGCTESEIVDLERAAEAAAKSQLGLLPSADHRYA